MLSSNAGGVLRLEALIALVQNDSCVSLAVFDGPVGRRGAVRLLVAWVKGLGHLKALAGVRIGIHPGGFCFEAGGLGAVRIT